MPGQVCSPTLGDLVDLMTLTLNGAGDCFGGTLLEFLDLQFTLFGKAI